MNCASAAAIVEIADYAIDSFDDDDYDGVMMSVVGAGNNVVAVIVDYGVHDLLPHIHRRKMFFDTHVLYVILHDFSIYNLLMHRAHVFDIDSKE